MKGGHEHWQLRPVGMQNLAGWRVNAKAQSRKGAKKGARSEPGFGIRTKSSRRNRVRLLESHCGALRGFRNRESTPMDAKTERPFQGKVIHNRGVGLLVSNGVG